MTPAFVLPIFPEGSLSESVVTTVWIGVFVLAMFNLRLGWTFSGLVIPGYLVPLIMVKPFAALVVFLEGVLTYAIVYFFARICSRWGLWSNLFGRDRFFALVLVSIAMRVVFDGYVLPELSRRAMTEWLIPYDFVNNLHSFGLIIVSLIANQFWKPGFARGITPLLTTVGITYLLVKYPLMHLTNFNMGSFEYMYEDIASSVLASPKAYMILVITAYVASRLNLYYSWDFNGILIPSLIAIQWYEPVKVLTSFIEAYAIFFAAGRILKLKALKETTVEGARKVLLFFNVSFVYKMILGHIVAAWFPQVQATDCFGFGYLLPSLMALKMHDKGIPVRIARTTLHASIVGACAAGLFGFALKIAVESWLRASLVLPAAEAASFVVPEQTLVERMRDDKVSMYQAKLDTRPVTPSETELGDFAEGMRRLRAYIARREASDLGSARALLSSANYSVVEIEGRYLYVGERSPSHGWGTYVLDVDSKTAMVVEVPAPLDEWATLECGGFIFKSMGARALAVSTWKNPVDGSGGPEALLIRRTFFDTFHRTFAARDVLQVRGYDARSVLSLHGKKAPRGSLELPDVPSGLWVKVSLPPSLSLSLLKELVTGLRVEWSTPSMKDVQRETTDSGFAELFLRRDDRRRLLALWQRDPSHAAVTAQASGIDPGMTLGEWIASSRSLMAERGTNLYVKPNEASLLYLDEQVLQPLMKVAAESWQAGSPREDVAAETNALHAAAVGEGYEAFLHSDASGDRFLILRERRLEGAARHWGAYVFRLGAAAPFAIEVPHPIYEENTLELGIALFEKLKAACMFIAGAHPKANLDGSADVVLFENKGSLFNLANQVLLRDTGLAPICVVQVRALGFKTGVSLPSADALLAFSDANIAESTLSPLGKQLTAALRRDGISVQFVDGSRETAGYEVYGSAQAMYLSHTSGKECAGLWLSPFVRFGYRGAVEGSPQESQFTALGIELSTMDLAALIASAVPAPLQPPPPAEMLRLLRRYRIAQDINCLYAVMKTWPKLRLQRAIERSSQKAFLVAEDEGGFVPFTASLSPPANPRDDPADVVIAAPPSADDLKRFAESGASFLLWGHE